MNMIYVSGEHCDTYCEHHAPDDAVPDVNNSEWDCPVHCAECHKLLDATLTENGNDYVLGAVKGQDGDPEVLAAWAEMYSYLFDDHIFDDDWNLEDAN